MKRSEVISILDKLLLGNYPLAETILNELEDLGMLPPPEEPLEWVTNKLAYYHNSVNGWEEE